MNVVYSASAYPFGRLSDRAGPVSLLAWGVAALVGADVLLAMAANGSPGQASACGACTWG
jgi:MFS family permease